MVKYNVDVLEPGVTNGVSGISREYGAEVLQEAAYSLEGVEVTNGSSQLSSSKQIGQVVDAEFRDGSVQCTIEIEDDEMAARIDDGLASVAPAMILDSDKDEDPEQVTDMEFRKLFLTPRTSELVGDTERMK